MPVTSGPNDDLFIRLRAACLDDWTAYTQHRFVSELAAGTLPVECFRYYLVQDYRFLIHFSRAWALAVFKSESLDDMREAAVTLNALLNEELELHVSYCEGWGISQRDMEAQPEATANMAYTRYVLERGIAGDLLDLLVALAPCVLGYGEIGVALADKAEPSHPYRQWIATYAGDDYQAVAAGMRAQLQRTADRLLTNARERDCRRTFRSATRLEIGFWDMALARSQ